MQIFSDFKTLTWMKAQQINFIKQLKNLTIKLLYIYKCHKAYNKQKNN
jgi:hypothetical protein